MDKIELNSLSLKEMEDFFISIGQPKYRGKQLFEYIHKQRGKQINEITVFSKNLREKLEDISYISQITIEKKYLSKIDGTAKYLFRLEDNQIIESVYMPYDKRNTICISTQVGCKMGCSFCASTKEDFKRNLKPSEIVSQIYELEKDTNSTINNIVVMGIGEPLDNYDNLIKALDNLTHPLGTNMSKRNITISTSGLVHNIIRLADENKSYKLAISLHYPFDDERETFMPVNKKYEIKELIEASEYYYNQTGRRVSYEYVLIEGLNDSEKHLDQLVKIFNGKNIHINLIPLNEIDEFDYKSSAQSRILEFNKLLNKRGLNSTVRNKKGDDIDAACGQLRVSYNPGEVD